MNSSEFITVCIVLKMPKHPTWIHNLNLLGLGKMCTTFILTTIKKIKTGFVITNLLGYFASQYSNDSKNINKTNFSLELS